MQKALDKKRKADDHQRKERRNIIIASVAAILYIVLMIYAEPSIDMFAISAGTAILVILFVRLCVDVHAIRKYMEEKKD